MKKRNETAVNEAAVAHGWTWEELASAIRRCGGEADEKTLQALSEKLEEYLKGDELLDHLMEGIDVIPPDETAKTLFDLGISLPDCGTCVRLENGYCWHYCERMPRASWSGGVDCSHFATSEPKRALLYEDADFPFPIISLTGKFPAAKDVVDVLRKDPRWAYELGQTFAMVDDAEDPEKWSLE